MNQDENMEESVDGVFFLVVAVQRKTFPRFFLDIDMGGRDVETNLGPPLGESGAKQVC